MNGPKLVCAGCGEETTIFKPICDKCMSQAVEIPCGIRDAQRGKTCEPFDDPRSHDFQGWEEFEDGRGGTTVCTRCGISSFAHAMRYAP